MTQPSRSPALNDLLAFSDRSLTMNGFAALGGDSILTFRFSLDTTTSPRRIVMVDTVDDNTWNGIYRVASDTLWITLPLEHTSETPAPPTFDGSNTIAMSLERVTRSPGITHW